MDELEKNKLETFTISLLENPDTYTSTEYICAYDIIYNHCTKITPVFETKGKLIYDLLKSILQKYTSSLNNKSSLSSLHKQMMNYKKSVVLLRKNYSYLERYFIKINNDKRNGHINDINSLAYSTFYRHYAEFSMKHIKEVVLFEIGISRTNRNYNFLLISEVIDFIRKMFYNSDEDGEYISFINTYLYSFYNSVDFNGEIPKLLKRVYLEIYIASKIFNDDNSLLYKNIVSKLRSRFTEILDFILKKANSFEKFKTYIKIVYFMGEDYLKRLQDEYKKIVAGKILESENFNNLLDVFLKITDQITENFQNSEDLMPTVRNQVKEYFDTFGKENMIENEIIQGINAVAYETNYKEGKLEALVSFINLMPNKEKIIEGVTNDFQLRLLIGKSFLKREDKLVKLMEKHLGGYLITKAMISFSNHSDVIKNNFTIATQQSKINTELRLLTKGFYEIKEDNVNLVYPFTEIQKMIVAPQRLKYPRSEVKFCHHISSMIFQISQYNFRMNTDKFMILWNLNEEKTLEELKNLTGGVHFNDNINFLLSYKFIVKKSDFFILNQDFSDEEYVLIKNKFKNNVYKIDDEGNIIYNFIDTENLSSQDVKLGSSLEEIIDLFEIKIIQQAEKRKELIEISDSYRVVLEAKIMKILKKKKTLQINQIIEEVCDIPKASNDEIIAAIERLIEKEYASKCGEHISYIP